MLQRWLQPAGTLEQQHAAAAIEVEQRIAEDGIPAPAPRRSVGRPRLLPLAAASGTKHPRDGSEDADSEQPQKRQYHHWLSSALFPHIVKAYNENGHSARAAVRYLQHSRSLNVSGVFDALNPSTVHQWFDATTHQLTPRVVQLRSNAERYSRVGVAGRPRVLDEFPEVELEMKRQLLRLREGGVGMHLTMVKHIMGSIVSTYNIDLKLSRSWLQRWIAQTMDWTCRAATSSSGKLPTDWRDSGTALAKRIAVDMQQYAIHQSLVINADQTGLQLCPGASRTYEKRGAKRVLVAGHDDKRQITGVMASSLSGELLPMQLVFQGTTNNCHPPDCELSVQQGMHLTHSYNHWSNIDTTKDWIRHIVEPWRKSKIAQHGLENNAHVLVILDVWRVHTSADFRSWLEDEFPQYHLRFVPPNCTSELQVADVALNFPFKHAVKKKFNNYVAQTVAETMQLPEDKRSTALKQMLLMSRLKPLLLQWLAQAWQLLAGEKLLIFRGWKRCLIDFYDVTNEDQRKAAVNEAKAQQIDTDNTVPAGSDTAEEAQEPPPADSGSEAEQDSSDDEKPTRQVMKERIYGERRSSRARAVPERFGLMIRTDQLQIVPDRDSH